MFLRAIFILLGVMAVASDSNSVRYLVQESELPQVAEQHGLDAEAKARLAEAHERLVHHQARPKPDPVAANGELFVDWPKPDAALLFTGEQIGYLEPCGCAGLENQKGGLKRRHTLVEHLRDERGWPLALFDSGEQIRHFGSQAEIKLRNSLEALVQIGYDAVGFGPRDLRTDLLGTVINLDEATNPLTSANVALLDFESGFTQRWRVVEQGGVRIGVTSVLGDQARKELSPSDDVLVLPAAAALEELLPTIIEAACDQNVLLVYGNAAEASDLARQFDQFDWVVAGTGSDEPPYQPSKIEGTKRGGGSVLIDVGHKGMYAIVVGLYRQPGADAAAPGQGWTARYQKTPIDHRWADAPAMQQRLVDYQHELEALGWKGLGLRAGPHPTERDFAGSAICADCHTAAWDVFVKTPHHSTTETLVALSPARHYDPECIACHAIGWEPQKYFPFATGWQSYAETPHLAGNGCENCHGPAARHAAVELGDLEVDEAEEEALRQALHMEIGPNEGNGEGEKLGRVVENCLGCHDLDNSPDFNFQEYWEEVAHEGVD